VLLELLVVGVVVGLLDACFGLIGLLFLLTGATKMTAKFEISLARGGDGLEE
jgi:hypothetical protein